MGQDCNYTNEELTVLLTGGEPGRDEGMKCLFLDKKLERSVYREIMREGGSADDAKNAYQDGFLIFHRHIATGSFRGDSTPATYFVAICTQHWKNKRKLKSRTNTVLMDDPLKFEQHDPGGSEGSFEDQEIRQLARSTLELVKGECKEILWMRANGVRHRQIAEKLGIKEDSVKNKIFRCNKTLRDKLEEKPGFKLFIKNILRWL